MPWHHRANPVLRAQPLPEVGQVLRMLCMSGRGLNLDSVDGKILGLNLCIDCPIIDFQNSELLAEPRLGLASKVTNSVRIHLTDHSKHHQHSRRPAIWFGHASMQPALHKSSNSRPKASIWPHGAFLPSSLRRYECILGQFRAGHDSLLFIHPFSPTHSLYPSPPISRLLKCVSKCAHHSPGSMASRQTPSLEKSSVTPLVTSKG